MNSNFFIIKSKCIIVISMALFLISIGLQTKELYTKGKESGVHVLDAPVTGGDT